MIVGIHQLHYLPWLRYFHKIASCDVFVVLDNIQFNKNGWQNRNKVKSPQGAQVLTVPVLQKFAQSLSETKINNKENWRRKHAQALSMNYSKSTFWDTYQKSLLSFYEKEWENLNDINYAMLFYFIEQLGIKTRIIKGSEISMEGEASDRLVSICKELGAKSYLTGAYAAETYLDADLFKREGLELIFQEFEVPNYSQLYPKKGFVPELAIIDLLFNCGDESLEVLMGSNQTKSIST